MSVKTAGVGHFTIPTAPAAGTSCTSGAANTFTTTYVQLIASTAAALYITGIYVEEAAVTAGTYIIVQLATGGAGSETIIGQYLVAPVTGSTVTRDYRPIFPPIPVANATRIACKTADSVGAQAKLITLECIAQSNVVDDGIAVGSVAGAVGSVTGAVGSVTGAVGSVTAAVTISAGTGAGQLDFTSGVVKANLAQILGTALTETAGQIAAAFKQFFNIGSPTGTVNLTPTTTTLTNAPSDSSGVTTLLTRVPSTVPVATDYTAARAAKLDNLDAAITTRSTYAGGAVASVTGSVASVTANVNADVKKINGTTVNGNGSTTPWGP